MANNAIPEGFHTVTPYLLVENAAKVIDFMKQAFDGKEIERMTQPDGGIMHAEVKIGDSVVMMGEARGEWKAQPCSMYVYVDDTDAVYERALQAGAASVMEPADQFYGDRNAGVRDPSGNLWWIATHKEDVPPEEMAKRAEAHLKQQGH
ncbi:MAG: VOC family protein [Acidobacteria bacterium]|nr:VOC family protein [Acidobacteriota bacterium]